MLIKVGYEFVFQVETPSLMLLMVGSTPTGNIGAPAQRHDRRALHPVRGVQRRLRQSLPSDLRVPRAAPPLGRHGRRGFRPARPGRALGDTTSRPGVAQRDPAVPAQQPVLRGRPAHGNCLGTFRRAPQGWGRVQAICNWVHANVRFDHQAARPTKTAYDVFVERAGVCRDFAHLALTFCRCLCIPARYATGYLGDIGVPPVACPMDFSGWFEVYLGGRWHTFDARHNVRRIGRVLMARGRDAADVAMTTSFGKNTLQRFTVWTDEVPAV